MKNNITYYRQSNDVEFIYYKNAAQSYPMHTHANHITLGYITDGVVCVTCEAGKRIYHAGEIFCIMPDILHAIETVKDTGYSMVSICIPFCKSEQEAGDESSYLKSLKKVISEMPENTYLIDDMARSVGVSPYHMIRQFKAAFEK